MTKDDESSSSSNNNKIYVATEDPPQPQSSSVVLLTPTKNRTSMASSKQESCGHDTPDTAASSISHLSFERDMMNPPPDDDETFGVTAEDFELSLEEIGTQWYGYMWTTCLGILGVLDILATYEQTLRQWGGCPEIPIGGQQVASSSSFCSIWLPFVHWLDKRDVGISFVFSLLWFKLAFNKASWAKERATILRDRDNLLNRQDSENNCENKKVWKPMDPQLAYFLDISMNMLFLPVGFYVIMYYFFRGILFEGKGIAEETKEHVDKTIVLSVTQQTYGDEGGDTQYEVFSEHTKISLLVALSHHIRLTFLAGTVIARSKLRKFLRKSAMPILIRKILGRAIRNPRKFRRNLSAALRYLWYVKYLGPIVGSLNKFKGNVEDMLKKKRQRMIAMKQRRIRQLLFRRKPRPVQEQEAATLVQCTWRVYKARCHTLALTLLTKDKKAIAAQRIQLMLRRKLAEARHKILVKRRELQRLERQSINIPEKMDSKKRRRLYELQDEFTVEAKRIINKKLLLRPNTTFAVLWKLMFVFCIGIEVSQNVFAPLLKNEMSKHSKHNKDGASIRELMKKQLIRKPVAKLAACRKASRTSLAQKLHLKKPDHPGADSTWYCREPYSVWLDSGRDIIALALDPDPVIHWPECKENPKNVFNRLKGKPWSKDKKSRPWFCSEPYATLQSTYRRIADFFIDKIMAIVSIICFMDVFVTFFTGEIHADTGELVPKDFFARWILPGLLMQLLLNPAIGPASTVVFLSMKEMYWVGPMRVLRWIIAVFVPIIYSIHKLLLRALEETDLDESNPWWISTTRESIAL